MMPTCLEHTVLIQNSIRYYNFLDCSYPNPIFYSGEEGDRKHPSILKSLITLYFALKIGFLGFFYYLTFILTGLNSLWRNFLGEPPIRAPFQK